MNSFRSEAIESLIDWSTPETNKNKNVEEQSFNNNPFDIMEMKAALMDPFDIVSDNLSTRIEPPCGNILSPMWEPQVRHIKKSVSMTGIDDIEHNNIDINEKQTFKFENDNETKEIDKENCLSSSCNDLNQLGIPNNEEEIKLLKEKTQQRIKMLIENSKKLSREKHEHNSFMYTPQNKKKSDTSLNITDSFLNKAFRQNSLEGSSTNFSVSISYKNLNEMLDINDNSTSGLTLGDHVYNSFDLNSLKPEWIIDNFSDNDASLGSHDIQKDTVLFDKHKINDCIDTKIKALDHIGIVNTKLTGSRTIVKSLKPNKINIKGPLVAHIPVKDMIQNMSLSNSDKENTSFVSPPVQIKPVASSTPTIAGTISKDSSNNTFVKIKSLRKSLPSPNTSLNIKEKDARTTPLGKQIIRMSTPNNTQLKNITKTLLKNSKQNDSDLKKTANFGKSKVFPVYKRFVYKGKENVKP
ncbi:uncharacterized protein LOC126902614 [Daktulosphaira vitifoliae]|uniref:uncharacterized protein LOC126902614 n=1 Tax=Daktulosphaira vitifoliae TaxID=58002 RepID=UPI0021A9AD6F|nr:uncharacterized protein LOC126902614 [Daktulosphaira vitifoliae]